MPPSTPLSLPADVVAEVESVICRQGMSFDAFVEEALRKAIAAELEREMCEAATLLGADPDSNVTYAFAAQAEVASRD